MRMKPLIAFLPLLALTTAGCIRIEQKLVINSDASGSFEVTYTVPDETTQRIKSMLKLANELSEAGGETPPPPAEDDFTALLFDPQEAMLRRRIESYAPLGIHLDELEVTPRNAQREVKLTLRFDNIAEVAKADFFANYGFSLVKSSAGDYVFYTRPMTKDKLDSVWQSEDQDAYKMMAPLLGGFHFELEIQTPGTIVKASNPDRQTPVSALWIYDFNSDQMAVANLQRKQMTIVFNSQGLNLPEFQQPARAASTTTPPSIPTNFPPVPAP